MALTQSQLNAISKQIASISSQVATITPQVQAVAKTTSSGSSSGSSSSTNKPTSSGASSSVNVAATNAAREAAVAAGQNPNSVYVYSNGSSNNSSSSNLDAVAKQVQQISQKVAEITPQVQAIAANKVTANQTPVVLPEKPVDNTNYNGLLSNASSTVSSLANNYSTANNTTPAASIDWLKEYLNENTVKPVDMTSTYNSLYDQLGIASKESNVSNKLAAVNAASQELNLLNAQIQGINAQAAASQQQLESNAGTGSDITSTFLGRQQQEVSRQAAIQALPLQSQALAASAKVTAAQGDASLAQQQLAAANDKLNQTFSIQQNYQAQLYAYNQSIIDKVYDWATDIQKKQLDQMSQTSQNNFTVLQNLISQANQYASYALQKGQAALASQIASLNPSAVDYQTQLSSLISKIKVDNSDNVSTATVNTNGHTYLINSKTGAIIKDLGAANSELGGSQSVAEKQQVATSSMMASLKAGGQIGQDGYISPQAYKIAKNAWVSEGFTPDSFDSTFGYLANPNDPSGIEGYGIKVKREA